MVREPLTRTRIYEPEHYQTWTFDNPLTRTRTRIQLQEEKVRTLNTKLEHVIVQAIDRIVSVQQLRQEIKVYENFKINGHSIHY